MSRRILIRFVIEQPRPQLDAKTGKPKGKAPRIDVDRMLASIQEQVTPLITDKWSSVDVQVVESRSNEIRIDGQWSEKADVVRAWVRDCLDQVMEEFDAEPFLQQPAGA